MSPTIFWVDPLAGNDANTGLSPATPIQNIQAKHPYAPGDELRVRKAVETAIADPAFAFTVGSNIVTTANDHSPTGLNDIAVGSYFFGPDGRIYKVKAVSPASFTIFGEYEGGIYYDYYGYAYYYYYGGSEIVVFLNFLTPQAIAARQWFASNGASGNRIKILGGWDFASQARDGVTIYDGNDLLEHPLCIGGDGGIPGPPNALHPDHWELGHIWVVRGQRTGIRVFCRESGAAYPDGCDFYVHDAGGSAIVVSPTQPSDESCKVLFIDRDPADQYSAPSDASYNPASFTNWIEDIRGIDAECLLYAKLPPRTRVDGITAHECGWLFPSPEDIPPGFPAVYFDEYLPECQIRNVDLFGCALGLLLDRTWGPYLLYNVDIDGNTDLGLSDRYGMGIVHVSNRPAWSLIDTVSVEYCTVGLFCWYSREESAPKVKDVSVWACGTGIDYALYFDLLDDPDHTELIDAFGENMIFGDPYENMVCDVNWAGIGRFVLRNCYFQSAVPVQITDPVPSEDLDVWAQLGGETGNRLSFETLHGDVDNHRSYLTWYSVVAGQGRPVRPMGYVEADDLVTVDGEPTVKVVLDPAAGETARIRVRHRLLADYAETLRITCRLRKNAAYGSDTRPKMVVRYLNNDPATGGLTRSESEDVMSDIDDVFEDVTITVATATQGEVWVDLEFESANAGAVAHYYGFTVERL